MIFRILPKEKMPQLFNAFAARNAVVGPVRKGEDRHGRPCYGFEEVSCFEDLSLEYSTTVHSAKRFFLPYNETLCSFTVRGRKWQKHVDYNAPGPRVFFGMHPCDINALNKLDKVLAKGVYPNPYYMAKRSSMFIVGIDCDPQPACFCRSMGADTALHGFDMFLTDLGDRYFVETLSAASYDILAAIGTTAPDHEDHERFKEVVAKRSSRFTAHVDTTDLTKILDLEFESPAWQKWGAKCLSCGTCANVCPTCYCYGVEEHVDMDLKGGGKVQHLYSCNLADFAEVAGGHNFRPTSSTRLKYRYYHKHRGFVEAYEEPLCVGCGRCGEACLAEITPPAVIESVRIEE